ncbi:hypothetical protein [Sorangium sp. So ce1335]
MRLRASSFLRCHRHPEQPTDRIVNDPGCHVIADGDGAAQG